ncbi:hypothetical protein HanRHA438_Chr04g0184911 [Helianthus annuus]|nr:hypothetical protein HanRHA438_Chr04g0184911 [Helianthus annuus]
MKLKLSIDGNVCRLLTEIMVIFRGEEDAKVKSFPFLFYYIFNRSNLLNRHWAIVNFNTYNSILFYYTILYSIVCDSATLKETITLFYFI